MHDETTKAYTRKIVEDSVTSTLFEHGIKPDAKYDADIAVIVKFLLNKPKPWSKNLLREALGSVMRPQSEAMREFHESSQLQEEALETLDGFNI